MKRTVFLMVIFSINLYQAFTDENIGVFLYTSYLEYFKKIHSEVVDINKIIEINGETTILSGNAHVRSDNLLLQADRIEIHGDDNQFIDCIGNVRVIDEEKSILFFTDRLRYDRERKIIRFEGNSTFEDKEKELVAKSNFIEYDFQEDIAVFQISVRFFMDAENGVVVFTG